MSQRLGRAHLVGELMKEGRRLFESRKTDRSRTGGVGMYQLGRKHLDQFRRLGKRCLSLRGMVTRIYRAYAYRNQYRISKKYPAPVLRIGFALASIPSRRRRSS